MSLQNAVGELILQYFAAKKSVARALSTYLFESFQTTILNELLQF